MKKTKKLINLIVRTALALGIVASAATTYEAYLYDYKGGSVVKLTMGNSGGTGFQVKAPSGKQYILTNAHICNINPVLAATTQAGFTGISKVIKIDEKHDLCIMSPIPGIRPLKIADSIDYHERVWLIGHPGLRPLTLESGHFAGMMNIKVATHCTQEEIKAQMEALKGKIDLGMLIIFMQGYCIKPFDAQYINNVSYGGNSGSPVVNKWGNVVGVLFAGNPRQPTSSFTVPLEHIHRFLSDK